MRQISFGCAPWLVAACVVLSMARDAVAIPVLSISPSPEDVLLNEEFDLQIVITDVDDLYAYDVELSYFLSHLNVVSITNGTFLNGPAGNFLPFIDNTEPTLPYTRLPGTGEASASDSREGPVGGVTDNGNGAVLFSVRFKALALGQTTITFDTVCDAAQPPDFDDDLFCTELENSNRDPIVFGATPGIVNISAPTNTNPPAIPEPATLTLVGIGMAGAALRRVRRGRRVL